MVFNSRLVKAWVSVSLVSLFVYELYWLINSFSNGYSSGFGSLIEAFNLLLGVHPTSRSTINILGHAFAEVGLIIRFFGLFLALLSVYMIWGRGKTFLSFRGKASAAVLLEGLFFLFLFPAAVMLMDSGNNIFALSYFIQILLTTPFLITLSYKMRNNGAGSPNTSLLKFFGVAYVGYVAAIWVNNTFSWVYVAGILDSQFLIAGKTAIGFINVVVVLSLALVFAMGWFVSLLKRGNNRLTTKLFGLSIALLGTYFLIYLIYSAFAAALNAVMLAEIWAIPLLGLGLSLFYKASTIGEDKKNMKHNV